MESGIDCSHVIAGYSIVPSNVERNQLLISAVIVWSIRKFDELASTTETSMG